MPLVVVDVVAVLVMHVLMRIPFLLTVVSPAVCHIEYLCEL